MWAPPPRSHDSATVGRGPRAGLPRNLAAEPIFVSIEAVRIGRQGAEALFLHVGAVSVGRRRGDADGGIGEVAPWPPLASSPKAPASTPGGALGTAVQAEPPSSPDDKDGRKMVGRAMGDEGGSIALPDTGAPSRSERGTALQAVLLLTPRLVHGLSRRMALRPRIGRALLAVTRSEVGVRQRHRAAEATPSTVARNATGSYASIPRPPFRRIRGQGPLRGDDAKAVEHQAVAAVKTRPQGGGWLPRLDDAQVSPIAAW
jgi:hypothetical protein